MRSATTTGVQKGHKSLRLEIHIARVISNLIKFLIISVAIRNLFAFYSLRLALTSGKAIQTSPNCARMLGRGGQPPPHRGAERAHAHVAASADNPSPGGCLTQPVLPQNERGHFWPLSSCGWVKLTLEAVLQSELHDARQCQQPAVVAERILIVD